MAQLLKLIIERLEEVDRKFNIVRPLRIAPGPSLLVSGRFQMYSKLKSLSIVIFLSAIGLFFSAILRWNAPIGEDRRGDPNAQRLLREAAASSAGKHERAVTIVIFTDYACPICRATHEALMDASKEDGDVQLVIKEWPILGSASVWAAKVALASDYQGIHPKVHDALMTAPSLHDAQVRQAVIESGGNWDTLETDLKIHSIVIDEAIEKNHREALALGLRGTPAYLVGPTLIKGSATTRQFLRTIKRSRRHQ